MNPVSPTAHNAIYLARDDAHNPDVWSGSPHWIGRTLSSSGFNLEYVCPLRGRLHTWYRIKGRLLRMLGYGHTQDGEWRILKSYAREASARLQSSRGQLIFSCGKPHLVFLETSRPILFFDDASMPAIIKTHPGHTNFFPPLLRRLLEAERRILEKCAYACYASDWAADAALEYYGAQFAPKIRVIPFGANMEVRRTSADIEEIIAKREPNACNLLFIGRYWNEKGGPIALATAEELHRRGLKVRLDLVGSQPAGSVPPYVRVHGFVSKKNAEGQRKLDELFRASHLLIVPTRFEAYGLVYVEASSYGLPSLGTAIGGVTTIIRKDANGRTFPLDACASNYADYAQALLKTPEKYHALSRSSFREFEQRLSWRKWGETVRGLAEPLLAGHRSEPALPK